MDRKLIQITETENIIRPRNSVLNYPNVNYSQGAPLVGGFDMQGGSLFETHNVVNAREERKILNAQYFTTENFVQNYSNYVEPEEIRKGVSSTFLNYTINQ